MDSSHPSSVKTSVMIKEIEDAFSSIREWVQFKQQEPLSVESVDELTIDMKKLELEARHLPLPITTHRGFHRVLGLGRLL